MPLPNITPKPPEQHFTLKEWAEQPLKKGTDKQERLYTYISQSENSQDQKIFSQTKLKENKSTVRELFKAVNNELEKSDNIDLKTCQELRKKCKAIYKNTSILKFWNIFGIWKARSELKKIESHIDRIESRFYNTLMEDIGRINREDSADFKNGLIQLNSTFKRATFSIDEKENKKIEVSLLPEPKCVYTHDGLTIKEFTGEQARNIANKIMYGFGREPVSQKAHAPSQQPKVQESHFRADVYSSIANSPSKPDKVDSLMADRNWGYNEGDAIDGVSSRTSTGVVDRKETGVEDADLVYQALLDDLRGDDAPLSGDQGVVTLTHSGERQWLIYKLESAKNEAPKYCFVEVDEDARIKERVEPQRFKTDQAQKIDAALKKKNIHLLTTPDSE